MARPQRNTVDYFPHLIGDGKKMFFIEQKYGNDGYATWFKILELLASTENHFLNLNNETDLMFAAAKCRVSEDMLLSIISDLAKLGIFDREMWGVNVVWCQVFIDSIQDAYSKRSNQCLNLEGLRVLLAGLGVLNDHVKPQSKEEYSKADQSKEEKNKISPASILGNQVMFSMVEMALDSFFKNNTIPKEFQPDFFDEWRAANYDKRFDDITHVRNSLKLMAETKGKLIKQSNGKGKQHKQEFTNAVVQWGIENDPRWKDR